MSTLMLLKTGEDVYYYGCVLSYTAAFLSAFMTEGEPTYRHRVPISDTHSKYLISVP